MKLKINNETIYYEKTTKFKSIAFGVDFICPFSLEKRMDFAILTSLITETNEVFKTPKELDDYYYDNYNLGISVGVHFEGENQIISFGSSFVNPNFLPEKIDLVTKAFELLNITLTKPFFTEEQVEIKKNALKNQLLNLKSNKGKYSYFQFVKYFLDGTITADRINQTIEDIDKVTITSLYACAKEYLTYPRTFYIAGDINEEMIEEGIKKLQLPKVNESIKLGSFVEKFPQKENHETIQIEDSASKTSFLYMGYESDIDIYSSDIKALTILCYLLGGGTLSESFRRIRTEMSLCYYVDCIKLPKNDAIYLELETSRENYEEVVKTIKDIIDDAKNGLINEEYLEILKNEIIANIDRDNDYLDRIRDDIKCEIIGLPVYSLEERKEIIKNITKDDLTRVAKKLRLDTIYFLRGE